MSIRTRALVPTLLILLATGAAAWGQYPNAGPPQPALAPPVMKTGVVIGGLTITPGEVMQELIGAIGPPDQVQAVRGRAQADDFVMFTYDRYGISVHIHNGDQTNLVGAIVVKESKVKLHNVPFKVGDDYKSVMSLWGQPDQQEPGFLAYWKRGVYVGVGDDGRIVNITLAEPGHLDNQQKSPGAFYPPQSAF